MSLSHSSSCPAPLRVALLLDTRAWAGTESHVLSLARALRALPLEDGKPPVSVVLATPHGGVLSRRAKAEKVPTVGIGRRGEWDPSTALLLARRLRSGNLDIIHAHNGRTALWGTLAVKLAGRGACVATQHFIEPAHASASGWAGRAQNAVHRAVEDGTAHHIAISRAVALSLLERSDVEGARVSVVYNGIEPPSAPDDVALPAELRADVACVARLEREKDLPTLIYALSILNGRRPGRVPVRAVLAGEGSEEAALRALIAETGAGDFVHLAGFTPHTPAILRAAKVAVLPSFAEPFGLAVLEAMAQSKPVIAVNAGGPPEIVRDGETGLLVPPRDPVALANALGTLLDDPARAISMGKAGYERLCERFSASRMAQETLAVYRHVAPA